jgi:hypothetical protein
MSEWRENANKRRDERRTVVPSIRPQGGSKRNTKRWCRGVVGREHTPVCTDYNELKRATYAKDWKVLVCTTCGKELDNYWPCSWFKSDKPKKPAWVVE